MHGLPHSRPLMWDRQGLPSRVLFLPDKSVLWPSVSEHQSLKGPQREQPVGL